MSLAMCYPNVAYFIRECVYVRVLGMYSSGSESTLRECVSL